MLGASSPLLPCCSRGPVGAKSSSGLLFPGSGSRIRVENTRWQLEATCEHLRAQPQSRAVRVASPVALLALPRRSQDAPGSLQLHLGVELLQNSSPGASGPQPGLAGVGKEVWEEAWQLCRQGVASMLGLQKFRDGLNTADLLGVTERVTSELLNMTWNEPQGPEQVPHPQSRGNCTPKCSQAPSCIPMSRVRAPSARRPTNRDERGFLSHKGRLLRNSFSFLLS